MSPLGDNELGQGPDVWHMGSFDCPQEELAELRIMQARKEADAAGVFDVEGEGDEDDAYQIGGDLGDESAVDIKDESFVQ